jgi:hypothetical protein
MIWVMAGAIAVLAPLAGLLFVDAWWQEREWMAHPGNRADLDGARHAAPEDIE